MSLTKEQAIRMAQSNWWSGVGDREIAMFQLHEPLLCMPFDRFHEAVEKALGRPVYTHEFGLDLGGLQKELMGDRPAPTRSEILELIPSAKLVLVRP